MARVARLSLSEIDSFQKSNRQAVVPHPLQIDCQDCMTVSTDSVEEEHGWGLLTVWYCSDIQNLLQDNNFSCNYVNVWYVEVASSFEKPLCVYIETFTRCSTLTIDCSDEGKARLSLAESAS